MIFGRGFCFDGADEKEVDDVAAGMVEFCGVWGDDEEAEEVETWHAVFVGPCRNELDDEI